MAVVAARDIMGHRDPLYSPEPVVLKILDSHKEFKALTTSYRVRNFLESFPQQSLTSTIPVSRETPVGKQPSKSPKKSATNVTQDPEVLYEVQKGDTLESVAKKFSTQAIGLRLYNNLPSRNIADVKVLKIPGPSVNFKDLKSQKEKAKLEQKAQKVKQLTVAFQGRTLIQSTTEIEQYLKSSKNKYYQAAAEFHKHSTTRPQSRSPGHDLQKSEGRRLFPEKQHRFTLGLPLDTNLVPIPFPRNKNFERSLKTFGERTKSKTLTFG